MQCNFIGAENYAHLLKYHKEDCDKNYLNLAKRNDTLSEETVLLK